MRSNNCVGKVVLVPPSLPTLYSFPGISSMLLVPACLTPVSLTQLLLSALSLPLSGPPGNVGGSGDGGGL